ncbi:MAG: ester cyclase, partial [Actinomycetota bacterium]|nr:ester cyclase [Actinomycetota bacterium]
KVVSRWTASGTHRGRLMGIAPTGKVGTVRGVSVVLVVNEKIQEDWISWDQLGMWEQLGVVAPPVQIL